MKKNIISKVLSVQIGKIKIIPDDSFKEKKWETGSYKEPVDFPLDVKFDGVVGDEISDLVYHGGVNKVIFANSAENYIQWCEYLECESLEFGALAENITISNIKEEDVYVGDVHKIGTAILEVSQPRQPCWKISKKHNNETFKKNIHDTRRTGWYYRVLQEGQISKNDDVELAKRLNNSISIFDANEIMYNPKKNEDITKKLIDIDELGEQFKNNLISKYKAYNEK